MGQIKYRLLDSGGLSTGGENIDSLSSDVITPKKNRVVLVAIAQNKPSVTPGVAGISGLGMTWTQVNTRTQGNARVTLFRGVSSSPSTGQITFTFVGNQDVYFSIVEFYNIDFGGTNGSDAIVQSAVNSTASANSLAVTLSDFLNGANAAYGVFYHISGQTPTPGSGFTQVDLVAGAHKFLTEIKGVEDTTVDMSVPNTGERTIGIAVELKAVFYGAGILAA